MSRSAALLITIALFAGLLSACERADHPNRELPEDFEAALLTGETLTRTDLKGPMVVNLWVPG